MTNTKCTFVTPRAEIRINRILEALKSGPLTAAQLAPAIFTDRVLTSEYLKHLMGKPRRVRIVGFADNFKTAPAPLYGLGSKPDAVYVRKSRAEMRAAQMADPVRRQVYLDNRRAKHKAKRAALPTTAAKLKGIDRRDPPLIRQVATMIAARPYLTNEQLAAALGAKQNSINAATVKLRNAGEIQAEQNGRRAKWESLTTPPVRHEPVSVPVQSWFSALIQSKQEGAAC